LATTKQIIEGMTILLPYYDNPNGYHSGAEHDVLYMYETDKPVSDEDKVKLEELGWNLSDSNGWEIFT
jgi:hypothetical protein